MKTNRMQLLLSLVLILKGFSAFAGLSDYTCTLTDRDGAIVGVLKATPLDKATQICTGRTNQSDILTFTLSVNKGYKMTYSVFSNRDQLFIDHGEFDLSPPGKNPSLNPKHIQFSNGTYAIKVNCERGEELLLE